MAQDPPPESRSPAQAYSFRVPSPPRVIVPPLTLNQNGIPKLELAIDAQGDYQSSGFSNVDFLSTVTYGNLITKNNMMEWIYEQRRCAQKILPFLYLGPMNAAKDKEFLVKEGITMVLAMRNTQSAHAKLLGSRAAHELGLEVVSIDVNGNPELIAAFPRGIEAINAHLSKMYKLEQAHPRPSHLQSDNQGTLVPGKVLVFCESGNERSAAMVAAYIMAMYTKDLTPTLQLVQAQRFCVALDDSLRDLLRTYDAILKAKRDVHLSRSPGLGAGQSGNVATKSSNNQAPASGKSTKRTFDAAHEDDLDVDMEGNDGQLDAERFEARNGLQPFAD